MSTAPQKPKLDVASQILLIRGQRVLMDSNLAALYGVATFRFNEAVKRNQGRFPADFAFHVRGLRGFDIAECDVKARQGRRY